MNRLTRRGALTLLMLGAALPALARPSPWIEVMGSAHVNGAADLPAARRRAIADALLAAAFAGGAEVRGHSVMANTRLTSDLLVVRPTGRVLAHRLLSEELRGALLQVRIAAQVAPPGVAACEGRRHLVLTLYPPRIEVTASAPAWAEALAQDLSRDLLREAERHPAVAEAHYEDRLPLAEPGRDRLDYHSLVSGTRRVTAGGHGLQADLRIAPEGRDLRLSLRLRLDGPAGERAERQHEATIPLPGPSPLGRAAPLAVPDRQALAHRLGAGAVPALRALLEGAGCLPVVARVAWDGGRATVPVGRVHGLTATSLAVTVDEATPEMLEIRQLSDRSATLAPIDPGRVAKAFAGRPVRFIDTATALP